MSIIMGLRQTSIDCGNPPRRTCEVAAGASNMRRNLPVTQREYKLPPDATLLSTTDRQGRITYAYGAFIEASGFSREELMGQPHNIVRHPDMPPAAFADMWRTIGSGRPWSALVKNRRKDGDHYWVRANAVAMRRAGEIVGYLSVRTSPGEAEVAAAERLYAEMRAGRARHLALQGGVVVRRGLLGWLAVGQRLPLAARVGVGVALAAGPGLLAHALLAVGAVPAPVLPLAAALGAACGFGWLWVQLIAPLRRITGQALAVASGEAVRPIVFDRVDEIGALMVAVNQSGLNMRALIDDVAEQVGGLTAASGEIAAGSRDLSARTEQSASSLQQTAAAMEQLTQTLQHNLQSARQVSELSQQAKAVATVGGQAMRSVVEQMTQISESSRRIADIVGLIDSIAFQTNLLALNAAVEAARAGEQGRGFAVVAAEVRALAQRSAAAAREIKTMIDASAAAIATGGDTVGQAGRTIDDVVVQVDKVSALIAEITAVSTEQASGIGQVGQAVSTLDDTTQQNAALVEQSAAAAESLRQQSGRLAEAVGVYRAC
jgi:aerotaxis receptor